jgi:membrane fusion protein (multidrug efflux system)
VSRDAITVPQRTVALGPNGTASVLVIGEGNKVEKRAITLDRAIGDHWVVASGLDAQSRIIIEGRQKARDGDVVRAVDYVEQASGATSSAAPASAAAAK